MKHLRIVVVGTGTNIGKTHAAVSILKALTAHGLPATGLKPVESGVGLEVSDTVQLAAASSRSPSLPAPYAFAEALSPHLAARRAGMRIELDRIAQWVVSHTAVSLVIETAGALLSPLGPVCTNLTLAEALEPTALVLVAPDRLGALHEVASALVTLGALAPQLPRPVVLLQPPDDPDASTGTNAHELQVLGITEQAWTLERASEPGVNAPVVLEALRAAGCFT